MSERLALAILSGGCDRDSGTAGYRIAIRNDWGSGVLSQSDDHAKLVVWDYFDSQVSEKNKMIYYPAE